MPTTPLQPFTAQIPVGTISPQAMLSVFFYIVLIYWIIYSVIAVYHWLHYSHNASIALPAIAAHFFVSIVLIGYVVSGLL